MSLHPDSQYTKSAKLEDHQLGMLKVDQEVSWEGKDKQTASIQKRGFEDIVTSLQSILGNQASIGGDRLHNTSMEVPYCKQVEEIGSVQREIKAHSDKVVTKIKLPEVIVCFDDGASQIVKDICIDEGLHPLEKILSENSEVNEKISSVFKSCLKHANDDPVGGGNCVALSTEEMKSASNFEKDSDTQKSWSSSGAGDRPTTVDEATSNIHEKKNNDPHPTDQGKSEKDATGQASSNTTWTLFTSDSDGTNTTPKDDSYTGTAMPFDAADANQASETKENSADQTSQYQSIHTLLQSDLKASGENYSVHENHAANEEKSGISTSGTMTARSSDASRADIDRVPFLKAHDTLSTEETTTNSTTSMGSSFHNNNQEDLSGPSYLSGSKVSSAHIAYSGNISHRSDSSTSIRSFAFPVLPSEWNASPIRMAKADRRRQRKNRCWGIQLCCKF